MCHWRRIVAASGENFGHPSPQRHLRATIAKDQLREPSRFVELSQIRMDQSQVQLDIERQRSIPERLREYFKSLPVAAAHIEELRAGHFLQIRKWISHLRFIKVRPSVIEAPEESQKHGELASAAGTKAQLRSLPES